MSYEYRPNIAMIWPVLFVGPHLFSLQPFDHFLQEISGEETKQVREVPRNSNRGPQVDAYLTRVGVSPGLSWCCAFVYWCFDEAAKALASPILWSRPPAVSITGTKRPGKAQNASSRRKPYATHKWCTLE
jgi:hypothetical protein